jgi:hypothetical protein
MRSWPRPCDPVRASRAIARPEFLSFWLGIRPAAYATPVPVTKVEACTGGLAVTPERCAMSLEIGPMDVIAVRACDERRHHYRATAIHLDFVTCVCRPVTFL